MHASFQTWVSGFDLYEAARGTHPLAFVAIVVAVDNGYKCQGMGAPGRFIQVNIDYPL